MKIVQLLFDAAEKSDQIGIIEKVRGGRLRVKGWERCGIGGRVGEERKGGGRVGVGGGGGRVGGEARGGGGGGGRVGEGWERWGRIGEEEVAEGWIRWKNDGGGEGGGGRVGEVGQVRDVGEGWGKRGERWERCGGRTGEEVAECRPRCFSRSDGGGRRQPEQRGSSHGRGEPQHRRHSSDAQQGSVGGARPRVLHTCTRPRLYTTTLVQDHRYTGLEVYIATFLLHLMTCQRNE